PSLAECASMFQWAEPKTCQMPFRSGLRSGVRGPVYRGAGDPAPARGGAPRCAVDPRWACTTAAAMSTATSTTLFLIAGRFYRRPLFGCRICAGLGVLPTGLQDLQELQQIGAFLCIEVDRVLRPVRGTVVGVAVQVVDDLLEC